MCGPLRLCVFVFPSLVEEEDAIANPKSGHISLGLVFHNHQPVGQSNEVFEDIYRHAYEPLLAALERHPGVRVGLHYTGSLLDWLREARPDFVERLRRLVARGQVEMLSGGYYEPILPAIPDDDKRLQVLKLSAAVQADFGYRPAGMWLAERVWEPSLPSALHSAGIEWTILDDNHFKMAGLTDDQLHGYYVTENNGDMVSVFASSKRLRYTIPWRPVEETLNYLLDEAVSMPGKVLVMGDDGEKLGAWPDTYEHCWGSIEAQSRGEGGWVEEFFTMLESNASWLHTVKLTDHIRHFPAAGRIYLPTASYNEMMEWAFPAQLSYEFTKLYHQLDEAQDPAAPFMHAGFWRNFLVKYPEANTQHKKMLRVHDKVALGRHLAIERGDNLDLYGDFGQEDLWRGQSNDTYWHGLFGGVYMTDIRVRVQSRLIQAQTAAERGIYGDQNWLAYEITDFDCDSMQELLLEGNALNLYIDLADGGSIFEWDLRSHNYNLASTVSRRPESYHQTLRDFEEKRRKARNRAMEEPAVSLTDPGKVTAEIEDVDGEPVSPHEVVRVREEGLDRFLNYDTYRRACMRDHFLGPGTTLEGFSRGKYSEEGDFVTGAYQAELLEGGNSVLHAMLERDGFVATEGGRKPVRVSKRLSLKPGSPDYRILYTIQNTGPEELSAVFGSEWNINLLGGGHNPSAYYRVEGHDLEDAALDSTGEVRDVSRLAVGNRWLGIEMALSMNHNATFWRFPIETVSGSEAGFERTYQGSCLLLQWPLKLPPGESVDIELEWTYSSP